MAQERKTVQARQSLRSRGQSFLPSKTLTYCAPNRKPDFSERTKSGAVAFDKFLFPVCVRLFRSCLFRPARFRLRRFRFLWFFRTRFCSGRRLPLSSFDKEHLKIRNSLGKNTRLVGIQVAFCLFLNHDQLINQEPSHVQIDICFSGLRVWDLPQYESSVLSLHHDKLNEALSHLTRGYSHILVFCHMESSVSFKG